MADNKKRTPPGVLNPYPIKDPFRTPLLDNRTRSGLDNVKLIARESFKSKAPPQGIYKGQVIYVYELDQNSNANIFSSLWNIFGLGDPLTYGKVKVKVDNVGMGCLLENEPEPSDEISSLHEDFDYIEQDIGSKLVVGDEVYVTYEDGPGRRKRTVVGKVGSRVAQADVNSSAFGNFSNGGAGFFNTEALNDLSFQEIVSNDPEEKKLIISGNSEETPKEIDLTNFKNQAVEKFATNVTESGPRQIKNIFILESGTNNYNETINLANTMTPAHLIISPNGVVTQHADLTLDICAINGNDFGKDSVVIMIVSPYNPSAASSEIPNTIMDAEWAEGGKYVVPTAQQLDTLYNIIKFLSSLEESGIAIKKGNKINFDPFINQAQNYYALSGPNPYTAGSGILASSITGATGGGFPSLYCYVKQEEKKNLLQTLNLSKCITSNKFMVEKIYINLNNFDNLVEECGKIDGDYTIEKIKDIGQFRYPEFKPYTGEKIPKYGYTRFRIPKKISHTLKAVRSELLAAGSDIVSAGAFCDFRSKMRGDSGNNYSGYHLLGRAIDLGVPAGFGSSKWFDVQPYVITFAPGYDLNSLKPYFTVWGRAVANSPGAEYLTINGLTKGRNNVIEQKSVTGWFINITKVMAKHGWTPLRDQNKTPLSQGYENGKLEWWHFEYRGDFHTRAKAGETILFGDEIAKIYDSGFNKSYGGIYKQERKLGIPGWYDAVKNRKYKISGKNDSYWGGEGYGYFPR